MDAERCRGRPVSGPTGRSRADTGDRQAEYVGRPGPDPLQGKQLSFGSEPVRSRHGRVDAVSAAFAGPGDEDTWGEGGEACGTGLACQTGEAHGTEHIPGVRILRIQVATIEGGRKPGYAAAVDLAAGRSHQRPTRAERSRTDERLACEAPGRPPVGGRDVEGRGRHLRVAALFQSGSKVDAASFPGSKNVASADVVGTGREVGESRLEACRAACRVACGRSERTGGTVHWENARACTSGGIGRGGTRTRAGSRSGDRRTAGRPAMAGRSGSESRMCFHDAIERLSEDCGRTAAGLSGPGEDRPVDTDTDSARRPVLLAPESSGRRRACTVMCSTQAGQRQRQEGMAGRKVLSATWEGKPLKGQTPEALPARNKAGRVSGGATRQEAEKACRCCTAG
jgi:hypothetical protein